MNNSNIINSHRDNKFKIELYIDTGNKDDNDFAISYLEDKKTEIEEKLGYPLEWHHLTEKRACRIWVARKGSIEDNDVNLDELIKFAIPEIIKFKEIFLPFIKAINFPEIGRSEE